LRAILHARDKVEKFQFPIPLSCSGPLSPSQKQNGRPLTKHQPLPKKPKEIGRGRSDEKRVGLEQKPPIYGLEETRWMDEIEANLGKRNI
jgi:hypothetical protein